MLVLLALILRQKKLMDSTVDLYFRIFINLEAVACGLQKLSHRNICAESSSQGWFPFSKSMTQDYQHTVHF